MITIEFNAAEMEVASLPVAHTCVKTLKFPMLVYGNCSSTLDSNLNVALEYGGFGQA